jgi:hypothetical protein
MFEGIGVSCVKINMQASDGAVLDNTQVAALPSLQQNTATTRLKDNRDCCAKAR